MYALLAAAGADTVMHSPIAEAGPGARGRREGGAAARDGAACVAPAALSPGLYEPGAGADTVMHSPIAAAAGPVAGATAAAAAEGGGTATHDALLALLRSSGVEFTLSVHAATRTSEASAAARGATLASGAKAMFVRASAEGGYALAVLSAARRVDWKALRALLGYKRAALADEAEVAAVTGCVPGAVPPFGCLWPGVRTLVDESLVAQGDAINFNAGLRTASVHMSVADYLRVSRGTRGVFTDG